MSAALEISVLSPELAGLEARIRAVAAGLGDTRPLLEALGAELESQTKRRIAEEKTSPIGESWPDWDPDYAKTRHSGQSLLQADGGLLDSVLSVVHPDLVETGSNLVYAALHQFGGTSDMPPGPRAVEARPWAGVSPENEADLEAIVMQFAGAHLRRQFG